MYFQNWLKTLIVDFAPPGQRRNRRKARSVAGLTVLLLEDFPCSPMVETLETRTLLSVDPVLVADLVAGAGGSNPSNFVDVNGTLFFSADDGVNGVELWQSDGTSAGTKLLKDVRSGSGSSYPSSLANVNGTLFFRADDGSNGLELWQSDGTSAGTTLVKDIRSGINGSSPGYLTNVNGTLFFRANDGVNGYELWQSDGTSAGTTLVKDIRSGINGSSPGSLANVNGTLFFVADDGVNGRELWQSDGTSAGTKLVKDIRSGSSGSSPSSLTNVNGTLFFRADDGVNGFELWQSDGTLAGTTLVKDIVSGSGSSIPGFLTNVNGTLFFFADDGVNGFELWQSDGTLAGTTLVKDILNGSSSSFPGFMTNVNGTLFFVADDGVNGFELWQSDGTLAGTTLVKDILNGSGSSYPRSLTNVNGTLFFNAADGPNGSELWKADVPADTPKVAVDAFSFLPPALVKDIMSGSGGSLPNSLTNVNGTLFFIANDGTSGDELWKSDGTSAGTSLVKDIRSGIASSSISSLTNVNGTLFFRADDGPNGRELWKSDGTAEGTTLVKDIRTGPFGSYPATLTNVNGTLFFRAEDGLNGDELWKSDGTAAGTILVKDIVSGGSGSFPRYLTNVNGTLFFSATDGGEELWQSDGTAAGTTLVKDIRTGPAGSYPVFLTNVNGTLYFSANDGWNGGELWQSDGTSAGTTLVKDIRGGSDGSYPNFLTNMNGTLFFSANDGVSGNGTELWQSNGTSAGTTLVKDIRSGSDGAYPNFLTNVNGLLFFRAFDDPFGNELWQSDGTAAGTKLVNDIRIGSDGSSPSSLTNVNGTLFFSASDGTTSDELWSMPMNSRPQLTAFAAAVKSTTRNTEAVMTFADLLAQGNESDTDGTVDAFIVQAVSSGTLKIGAIAGSATPFAVGSNDKIDATRNAYWTPATNANGNNIAAFTVLAQDDLGVNSSLPVTVSVKVNLSAPTITGPGLVTVAQRPEVTWSTTAGAVSYEISISNLSTGVDPFHQATPTGTSYIPTVDLGIGQFRVLVRSRASDGALSAWSSPRDFRIATPVSVSSLNPVQTTLRPTITWAALPGAHLYDVWINNLSTGATQVVRNVNVSGTSFQVPANLAIGSYQVWVRGVATDGFAAQWSTGVNFGIAVPPTVTQGQNASFDRTPVLQWSSLPGANRYDVWIDNLSTGAAQVIRNTNVTSTTFTGPNTLPIGRYRAWVRGIAANGFSTAWTSAINFAINGAPTITQGQNSTFDRTPTLAWNALPGAAVYEVFLSNLSTGATRLHEKNITATQFTTPTLTDGNYRWWAIGVTAQGFRSLWTAAMDISIGGRPAFLTPSGTSSDTTPTFSWKPVDGAVRYDLWVDRLGGAAQVIRQQLLTTTSYTPETALPSGNYRAWVRAVSSTGEISVWSVPLNFTIAETGISPVAEGKLLPTLTSAIRARQIVDEAAADKVPDRIADHDRETAEPVSIAVDVWDIRNTASETEDMMIDSVTIDRMMMEAVLRWYGEA